MAKSKVAESEISLQMGTLAEDLDYDSNGDRQPDMRPRNSGITKTVVNVINTIIGSGILGLPAAVAGIGWVCNSLC